MSTSCKAPSVSLFCDLEWGDGQSKSLRTLALEFQTREGATVSFLEHNGYQPNAAEQAFAVSFNPMKSIMESCCNRHPGEKGRMDDEQEQTKEG